jgi:hypothetical protein
MAAYELGDFERYRAEIDSFRKGKPPEFEPYIATPVSTVFTGRMADLAEGTSRFLGVELVPPAVPGADYYAVTSCDVSYFEKYAEHLVRSFSRTCPRGRLVVEVIGGAAAELTARVEEWSAKNVTIECVDLDCGDNLGPVASLLRFALVHGLIRESGRPVLVLDVDCVITAELGSLVDELRGTDVASRILRYGVAPWEKYTGGFAIFMPTPGGCEVARTLACLARTLAVKGRPQWWIDQNCLEAAIRLVREDGCPLAVTNVMGTRDKYCVMPVGPAEAKLHILQEALNQVVGADSGDSTP